MYLCLASAFTDWFVHAILSVCNQILESAKTPKERVLPTGQDVGSMINDYGKRICKKCHNEFMVEADDIDFYIKIDVPAPTFCPHCRTIRRLLFRNERTWYRRMCAATNKPILSMFDPAKPYIVYEEGYWKSDEWDPLDYGKEYDFSKGFFAQFNELFCAVPHPNMIQKNNVNSPYTNYNLNLKNCYYCASGYDNEDSSYLFTAVVRVKNSFDLHQSGDSEYCNELIDSKKCNRTIFAQNCEGCVESALLYDCRNCTDCFGCVGIRNGKYMIFNEQYSKEEYQQKVLEFWNGSYSAIQEGLQKFNGLKLKVPRKYASILNSQNVSGDDILNARNCAQCFFARDNVENIKYSYRVWENTKDGMDGFVVWAGSELFYEDVSVTGQRVYFSAYIWSGNDIEYSYNCFDCSNIFGCVGLRSKSYCIFNTQYSKEDYETLVSKIKEAMRASDEYGEFFPSSISPFDYNETVAQDYFPTTKEQAIEEGFTWHAPEVKNYGITMPTEQIPDSISEVADSITKEVIACEHGGACNEQCATAFRITPDEFQFYKIMKLPLPRLCPNCRHYGRVKLKNPLKLWHRKCMNCSNEFETPYAPDRPEIIYCESCYNSAVN